MRMFVSTILSVILFMLSSPVTLSACACSDDTNFQSLCSRIIPRQNEIFQYVPMLACYCLCPQEQVKVIYPHNVPLARDLYHKDQLRFMNMVVRDPMFTFAGVVYASTADIASLPLNLRRFMNELGQPFLSHAYRLDHGPTDDLIFIPDHLFIRYNAFENIVASIQDKKLSYASREKKCFWRGSATAAAYGEAINPRYLICKAAKNISWIDVGITKAFTVESDALYDRQGR
jgi:hypothetical protein